MMRNRPSPMVATCVAALLGITAVTACRPEQPDTGPDNLASDQPVLPALPVSDPPLDRGRLLLAVARAASAYASGVDDLNAQRKLDGRQFEVRLRFGCEGQGPGRGDHGRSVDPDGRTLRLRVVPTISLGDELVRHLGGNEAEAAEGFWLPRPWMLAAACPAAAQPAEPASAGEERPGQETQREPAAGTLPPTAQRIGIVQFFSAEDSRTGRRVGRPFEAVKQLEEGESVGRDGFNLILSGRLRARGGRVILCSGSVVDRPPDCILSVDVDRVRIERPQDQQVMAEWSV